MSRPARIVAVLVCVLGLSLAASPRAAAGPADWDAWWLPDSWVSVATGTTVQAVNLLTGSGSVAVAPGSGALTVETPTAYDGATAVTPANAFGCLWSVEFVDWGAPGGGPRLRATGAGSYCNQSAFPYGVARFVIPSGTVPVQAVGGNITSQIFSYPLDASSAGWTSTQVVPAAASSAWTGSSWANVYWPAWSLSSGTSVATTTTTVTCRDSATGADFPVTETVSGVDVAPRPVCPSGSWPVRVQVSNSLTGLVSDSSVTAPDWYMGDPGAWEWGRAANGVPCVEGDTRAACSGAWDPAVNTCVVSNPTMALSNTVPVTICEEREAAGLPTSRTGTSEAVVDPDSGVIVRAIQRLEETVKTRVGAVAAGVEAVRSAVRAEGASTRSLIESAVDSAADRIESAVSGLRGRVDAAGAAVVQGLSDLRGDVQGIGSGPASGNPCDPGAYSLNPGDWVVKPLQCLFIPSGGLSPYLAALGSMVGDWAAPMNSDLDAVTGEFAPPAGGCSCGGIPLNLAAIGVNETYYFGGSCSGAMATAAAATRMAASVVLVVGVLSFFSRSIGSIIGSVNLVGGAEPMSWDIESEKRK